MEQLLVKKDGKFYFKDKEVNPQYGTHDLSPNENLKLYNHFAELADKLESGRTVVLQCKIGDAVYETDTSGAKIFCSTVKRIIIDGQHTIYETDGVSFDERAIGKTIFLTAEAVEARAKELQGKL